MPVTRREALAVLGAGALSALAGCGAATPAGVTEASGTLATSAWPGARPRWRLMRPAGVAAPRLVVALHGKGGSADDAFDSVRLGDQVARTGLAVASVDGAGLYWHKRRGSDTGAMVMDELVPLLRREYGVSASPIGLTGLSMGGYGALWLAVAYGPTRVAAVAAESAALWRRPGDSAPGAFDDREDFEAHDVFRQAKALAALPVRLDCGTSDPFIAANRALATAVPSIEATFDAGGHTAEYWAGHADAQMTWLAAHLTD